MAKLPETLIPVADAVGHTAAHAMASAVRDAGIEAFVFDTAKTTLRWETPGVIAPFQVHVRRVDADRARAVLAENRADSVDIDWDEIDVGQPEDATSAKIAGSISAPWMAEHRPRTKPMRDSVFAATKLGIVGWVLGSLAVAIISALLIMFGP